MISIVIPTRNSRKTLMQCLESIKNQTYKNYELIIVDGSSTDDTKEIARRYASKFFTSGKSLPGARNFGFSKATGDIFVSIDSDMILEETLLEEINKKIGKYGSLIIPEVGHGKSFLSRCKDLEKRCYVGDESVECARGFSRRIFEATGGYDSSLLVGEDRDFHLRIKEKFRVGRTESKIYHDTDNLSLISDLRKTYKYGKSYPRYLAKNPKKKGWFDPSKMFYVRHFSKLRKEPVTALGLFSIRMMECAVGLTAAAISSLEGRVK